MQNNLKTLEAENITLANELSNFQNREREYNRQISLLNQNNDNLIQQIESTQKMRIRLRNDIIGVIDENDQGEPQRYRP
jgi:chromosome segregation ATPase